MFKTKSKTRIIPALEYWQIKLNMDHVSEFARYKFLCNYSSKKNERLINGKKYITYHEWKSYIDEKIAILNSEELSEFYYFLNSKVRSSSISLDIGNNLIITLILSFYIPPILNALLHYINTKFPYISSETLLLINTILIVVIALSLAIYLIHTLRDDNLKKHYYEELKNIVEKRLPFTK